MKLKFQAAVWAYIFTRCIYTYRTINSGQATHAHAWTARINAYPHRYRGTNGFSELVGGEMNLADQFQRTEQPSLTWTVCEGVPFGPSRRRGHWEYWDDSRGNVAITFYAARTRRESITSGRTESSPLSLTRECSCDRLHGFYNCEQRDSHRSAVRPNFQSVTL